MEDLVLKRTIAPQRVEPGCSDSGLRLLCDGRLLRLGRNDGDDLLFALLRLRRLPFRAGDQLLQGFLQLGRLIRLQVHVRQRCGVRSPSSERLTESAEVAGTRRLAIVEDFSTYRGACKLVVERLQVGELR